MVFSPSGDANSLINFWKPIAEKYQFVIFASKLYHNGMYPDQLIIIAEKSYNALREVCINYKVDTAKIIYSGLSGGGSFSYYLNYVMPSVAFGLIINTARMWEDTVYDPIMSDIASAQNHYSLKPKVAMIASPTDFRYSYMQRDFALINNLGWKNFWIEFIGGHRLAPYETYYKAIDWLMEK